MGQEFMFPAEEESAVDGLIVEEGEESASEEDEQGMFEHFRLNVDKGQTLPPRET